MDYNPLSKNTQVPFIDFYCFHSLTSIYTAFVGDHVSIKLNEPLVAIETVLDTASFSKSKLGFFFISSILSSSD